MDKTLVIKLSVGETEINAYRGFPESEQITLSTIIKWYESFDVGDSGFRKIDETTTLGYKQEELFKRRNLFDGQGKETFEIKYGLVKTSDLERVYAGGEE